MNMSWFWIGWICGAFFAAGVGWIVSLYLVRSTSKVLAEVLDHE